MTSAKYCLLIDESPLNREVFVRALTTISPETICLTADSGKGALSMMEQENLLPSYIFIELHSSDIDAIQFLRALKQIRLLKEIPVIVHAVSPKPNIVIELKELGATAIYFRPYNYLGICNMLTLYFSNDMVPILPN